MLLSKQNNNYVGNCSWYNKEKIISYASLHASKTLIAGEGGIIMTNSKKISSKLRILRNHGQKGKKAYFYEMTGGNFRLSNLLASIGYSQLLRLNEILQKKKKLDNCYKRNLSKNSNLSLMEEPKKFSPIKFGFPILFKKEGVRDKIMKILNRNSTLCRPSFYSLYRLKHLNIYKNKKSSKQDFKKAEIATDNVLVLPIHNNLGTKEVASICLKINNYFKN